MSIKAKLSYAWKRAAKGEVFSHTFRTENRYTLESGDTAVITNNTWLQAAPIKGDKAQFEIHKHGVTPVHKLYRASQGRPENVEKLPGTYTRAQVAAQFDKFETEMSTKPNTIMQSRSTGPGSAYKMPRF